MIKWIAVPALLLGLSVSAVATESDWADRYSRAERRYERVIRKMERTQERLLEREMLRADLAYERAMRRAERQAYRHGRVYVSRPRYRWY